MEDLIDNPPKDLFAELDNEQQGKVNMATLYA